MGKQEGFEQSENGERIEKSGYSSRDTQKNINLEILRDIIDKHVEADK